MSIGNQNLRGAWLVLLAVVAAVVGIVALAGSLGRAAVPCDAQAGQMQPRKLTLEQRVRRLERIVADHEKRLTPTPAESPQ